MALLLVTIGGAALFTVGRCLYRLNIMKSKGRHQKAGKHGQPLKLVVAQCEARWFLQDLKLAMSGDCEAMVRVSHMLMSGYGTAQDHAAAAHWMRQAWAIQNYKEPAMLHEMLDVRDSDIPVLNDARYAAQKAVQRVKADTSSSSNSSSSGGSIANAAASSSQSSTNNRGVVGQASNAPGGAAAGIAETACSSSSTGVHQLQYHHQQQQQQQPSQLSEHTLQHCDVASQQQQQQQQQRQQQGLVQIVNKRLKRVRHSVYNSRLQSQRQQIAAAAAAAGDLLGTKHASNSARAPAMFEHSL